MKKASTSWSRGVLVALVLGMLLFADPAAAQQSAGAPAPAVTVATVNQRDITPSTSFTGRIEAIDKVDLRARVEGFLEQQLFTEGQDVKAGDLLFVIEKAPYQAEIENVDAAIARAQATLDLAEIERRRQGELVKKQATAQARLDDATGKAGEARADLRRQQANLTTAELNLGYTDIKAPIAGRIGRTNFAVGNFVGPQSGTLATIVSQDPMYVTFPVTQRQLLAVRKEAADGEQRSAEFRGEGSVGRRLVLRRARTPELRRRAVQRRHGHGPGPGDAAQFRPSPGGWPAGDRGGAVGSAASRPGDPAAGGPGRPGGPLSC